MENPVMENTAAENIRHYLESALAPRLQGDGGWMEFESLEKDLLTLGFRGECSKCEVLDRCARWIGQKISQDLGEDVRVLPVRRKPYFQDNV